jgi:Rab-GTPase-TBC domain
MSYDINSLKIHSKLYTNTERNENNNNTASTDGTTNGSKGATDPTNNDASTNATNEDDINNVAGTNMPYEVLLNDYYESACLMDEIHKDVVRTHPDLSFFLEPQNDIGLRRYAAIERILFVWSKYNKGVRYVQGMNEIVGILYFVLANDQNDLWANYAEPDTYWLFHHLLTDMQDVFVPDLDNADTGIQGRIAAMDALLARHDPSVKEHLDELGLEVSFYAIRWWTTLLSREFLLPDTIRLWDSMVASTHKDNFLRYVCVTMIMLIRDDLLKGDFARCLRLLQSYPPTHTDNLLESSRALWLYESQITVACHRGGISLHHALCTIQSPTELIMAFGFVNGKPPDANIITQPIQTTITSTIKAAARSAKAVATTATNTMSSGHVQSNIDAMTVRARTSADNARKSVSTSAQGIFGRAKGMYLNYRSTGSNNTTGRNESTGDKSIPSTETKKDDTILQDNDHQGVSTLLLPTTESRDGTKNTENQDMVDDSDDEIYMKEFLAN